MTALTPGPSPDSAALAGEGGACRHGSFVGSLCEDCLIGDGADARGLEFEGILGIAREKSERADLERSYPLPRLLSVTWRQKSRSGRLQHAVGFLVAEGSGHLVLCDQFDGRHPQSRRLWTIDEDDVVERSQVEDLRGEQGAGSREQGTPPLVELRHQHQWGPRKACPPDGDIGRECDWCGAVEFDRG